MVAASARLPRRRRALAWAALAAALAMAGGLLPRTRPASLRAIEPVGPEVLFQLQEILLQRLRDAKDVDVIETHCVRLPPRCRDNPLGC